MMVFACVGCWVSCFQGGVLNPNAVFICKIQTMIGPSLFREKSEVLGLDRLVISQET